MSEVVQASCPYCRNILRIPAAWVNQPMRCKHCGQIFQSRTKIAVPSAAVTARPALAGAPPHATATAVMGAPPAPSPISAPRTHSDLFAFDEQIDATPPLTQGRRQPTRWWIGVTVAAAVLAVGTVIGIIAGPQIAELFGGGSTGPAGKDVAGADFTPVRDLLPGDQGQVDIIRPDIIRPDIIRPDKSPFDKLPLDKVPFDKFPTLDKLTFDKLLTDKRPFDKGMRDKDGLPSDKGGVADKAPRDKTGGDKSPGDKAPSDKAGSDKGSTDKKINPPPEDGQFPRRALFISVCNYLYANPLQYGTPPDDAKLVRAGSGYPGSSTRVLKFLMEYSPMNLPGMQMAELTDGRYESQFGGKSAATTQTIAPFKRNIEQAITEFLSTARAQDRIMLFFAGHAVDIEKDSFLVPLEGDLGEAKTLIPMAWIYEQLAKCRAQEKVFIVDVCRFPPDRGFELPGGGEPGTGKMTEQLDALLNNPPPGVQVWASCIKDQNSIELERGGVFLRALCATLQSTPRPITEQDKALPLAFLFKSVNERMKDILAPQKLEQVSRLVGSPGKDGGYDPLEALPPRITLKSLDPSGSGSASLALVKSIKDEIDLIPQARQTRKPPDFLPPFPANKLALYEKDYKNLDELRKIVKADPEKYPVRAAVLEAIDALNSTSRITFKERLGGTMPIPKGTKEQFLRDQQGPGQSIFALEQVLPKLLKAGDKLDQEASKRWHAHYHYTLARFQSRIVYLYEYNFILAQVRGDQLPDIDPAIHNGWRVGSKMKISISEAKVKDMVKAVGRTWKSIAEEYPDTPWAVLAARERLTALGLEWRPSRD